VLFQPRQKCGAKVETDMLVIVDNIFQASLVIQYPGMGVGLVAFLRDPFIPVMERMGGLLNFNLFQPGILTRWLVKVAMDADVPW
jgi:hypothetical protein